MTRSYKMLVLQAMLGADAFPGSISLDQLAERFRGLARRHASIRNELGDALDEPEKLRRLLKENPIAAWVGGAGTGQVPYFTFEGDVFATAFSVPTELREAAQDLTEELVDWRLSEYLVRSRDAQGPDRFLCRVSHASGRPILFLPDCQSMPGLPEGWREINVDGSPFQANFRKVAINVVNARGSDENALPELLRGWFGPEAGRPGRTDAVLFTIMGSGYRMTRAAPETEEPRGLPSSEPIHPRGSDPGSRHRGERVGPTGRDPPAPGSSGSLRDAGQEGRTQALQYQDRFLSPTEFHWQSQNKNSQSSDLGQTILHHKERGIPVYLLVRRRDKVGGTTQPFLYAGELTFVRWEGERPITVLWELTEPVPEPLWGELGVDGKSD